MTTQHIGPAARGRRRTLLFLSILLVVVVGSAAACADDDDEVVAGGDGTTTSDDTGGDGPADVFEHPTGADEVVVQVTTGGGFVPVDIAVTTLPAFTLLGDGTVVEPGVVTAIYPGPAISPLTARHLEEADVQALLARAHDLGLLANGIDYGQPGVTDLPTTEVTITVSGTTYTHAAYALGFEDESSTGLTEAQIEDRRQLRDFVDATAPTGGAGGEPYQPERIAVYTIGDYQQPDPMLEQEPVTWPLATPPAPVEGDGFGCVLVEGSDVEVLLATLADANQASPWVVETTDGDAGELALAFRPLVPGDAGCS
jgi:hypothetical protein